MLLGSPQVHMHFLCYQMMAQAQPKGRQGSSRVEGKNGFSQPMQAIFSGNSHFTSFKWAMASPTQHQRLQNSPLHRTLGTPSSNSARRVPQGR